ncbi:TAXI family TRAP transporter solute-binding subunit [Streptomyces apocyni]|uniref:TAXI family TRAP transporter solute-binding subunit n=1 Tax=Streptomyces apocyni TaxID=2654677 RepID=UPI0012EA1EA8|nr:TAXI family TRAP transporter solute-binding subunit [Streptomyces apocyni]
MRSRSLTMATAGALALLLAACSQPAESGRDSGSGRKDLSIATGTKEGVYYPVGGSMAEIIKDDVDGVTATAEETAASVENMRLLASKESDLAIVQGDVAYQAANGQGDFDGKKIDNRALMVLYPNVYHAVSLKSVHDSKKLDCFKDVQGKRFSVGARGSGNEVATNLVLDALDLSQKDLKVQRYAYGETARALREGQIDAGSWVVGEGHATLKELEASEPIHLVPVCADEQKSITDKYSFYAPHTIKGGTYTTVSEDVPTIALWNLLVVPADYPEDQAYDVVKALYENIAEINKVYQPGAKYLSLESLKHSTVPLHPAVIRYAEEQGVEIPADLKP